MIIVNSDFIGFPLMSSFYSISKCQASWYTELLCLLMVCSCLWQFFLFVSHELDNLKSWVSFKNVPHSGLSHVLLMLRLGLQVDGKTGTEVKCLYHLIIPGDTMSLVRFSLITWLRQCLLESPLESVLFLFLFHALFFEAKLGSRILSHVSQNLSPCYNC